MVKNSSSYKILNEITIFFSFLILWDRHRKKVSRPFVLYVGSPSSSIKSDLIRVSIPFLFSAAFVKLILFSPNIDRQRENKESAQKEEKKIRWPCTSYINVYYTYLVTVWMKFMYQAWNTSGNNKKKMCDAKRA